MNQIAIAVLAAGGMVAGALLYSNRETQPIQAWGFEKAIKDQFLDPNSVMIRNVVKDQSGKFCGEVNAKNRMGGYSGWQRFMAVDYTSIGNGWSFMFLKPEDKIPGNLWCSQDWSR